MKLSFPLRFRASYLVDIADTPISQLDQLEKTLLTPNPQILRQQRRDILVIRGRSVFQDEKIEDVLNHLEIPILATQSRLDISEGSPIDEILQQRARDYIPGSIQFPHWPPLAEILKAFL